MKHRTEAEVAWWAYMWICGWTHRDIGVAVGLTQARVNNSITLFVEKYWGVVVNTRVQSERRRFATATALLKWRLLQPEKPRVTVFAIAPTGKGWLGRRGGVDRDG